MIFSVILLYLFKSKLKIKDNTLLFLAIFLYFIGVILNAYIPNNIIHLKSRLSIFYNIFDTSRNGLFFGFPFIFLGFYINKYSYKFKNKNYNCKFIISLLFLLIEGMLIYYFNHNSAQDMLFFLLPAALYSFLIILSKKRDIKYLSCSLLLRKMSTLIFGFHMFVYFYCHVFFTYVLKIKYNHLFMWILVLITTNILSYCIIKLSNKKYFKWLKYLY